MHGAVKTSYAQLLLGSRRRDRVFYLEDVPIGLEGGRTVSAALYSPNSGFPISPESHMLREFRVHGRIRWVGAKECSRIPAVEDSSTEPFLHSEGTISMARQPKSAMVPLSTTPDMEDRVLFLEESQENWKQGTCWRWPVHGSARMRNNRYRSHRCADVMSV